MRKAADNYCRPILLRRAQKSTETAAKFTISAMANKILQILDPQSFGLKTKPAPARAPVRRHARPVPGQEIFADLRRAGQDRWYHSGDIGDILYALNGIRLRGGGTLYLGPRSNLDPDLQPRFAITRQIFSWMAPFLRAQPYIKGVYYAENCPPGAGNLNLFRLYWRGALRDELATAGQYMPFRLGWLHWSACGILRADDTEPWLTVPDPNPLYPLVIQRTSRYQNRANFWRHVLACYGDQILFIGNPDEHKDFQRQFGPVRFARCHDLLTMAQIIAGAKYFLGNQSCGWAIAEGLKMPGIQETCNESPEIADCVFCRPNAQHIRDNQPPIITL
jgi:hypothetical protein